MTMMSSSSGDKLIISVTFDPILDYVGSHAEMTPFTALSLKGRGGRSRRRCCLSNRSSSCSRS